MQKSWTFFLLIFLVVLFWYPVMYNNNFFYDDWGFIQTIQEGNFNLEYLLAPHNEHFMPMFKGIFFLMYSIFGLNIGPYIWLLILVHIVNVCLFYYLCKLIFPNARWMPLALTLFFLSNTAYYEVLHWFILLSTAGSLLFLQLALIFLHLFYKEKKPAYYLISIAAAFFIPMNFIQGIIGIVFIVLYYFLVMDRPVRLSHFRENFRYLGPYVIAWLLFVLIYLNFAFDQVLKRRLIGIDVNYYRILKNTIFGFLGFISKSLGIGILMHQANFLISGFLILNLVLFLFFLLLYFVLNPSKKRERILHDRGIALFAFLGALISYLIIAAGRTNLTGGVFLNWGRYQFFSTFFLTIFLGTFILAMVRLFSKVFDKKRFKAYLALLLILYLVGQFVMIRQKAGSTVRMEGYYFDRSVRIAINKNTSTDTLAATWPA